MEKSSRSGINIRKKEDGPPDIKGISDPLIKRMIDYLCRTDHSKKSRMTRIKEIYDLTDAVIDEMSETAVCRKGCSYCCKVAVEIIPIEAEYIQENTILKMQNKDFTLDYCPLMDKDNATCSIYEYRPFNCRTFLAFDSPDYCRDDLPHFITGGPENGYGNKALLQLAMTLIEVDTGMTLSPELKEVVEKRVRDIRSYF